MTPSHPWRVTRNRSLVETPADLRSGVITLISSRASCCKGNTVFTCCNVLGLSGSKLYSLGLDEVWRENVGCSWSLAFSDGGAVRLQAGNVLNMSVLGMALDPPKCP